jgi:hypothetical protein
VSTASLAGSYRGLFAKPVLRRLAVADACARLPQGMVSLTVLLVAAEHASMTTAGLAVAGYTLLALAAPLAGLCLGPTLASLFSRAADAALRGGGTETQAWINSIMNGGAAGGAALAGAVLASPGSGRPLLALGLASVLALGAGAVTGARARPVR